VALILRWVEVDLRILEVSFLLWTFILDRNHRLILHTVLSVKSKLLSIWLWLLLLLLLKLWLLHILLLLLETVINV